MPAFHKVERKVTFELKDESVYPQIHLSVHVLVRVKSLLYLCGIFH